MTHVEMVAMKWIKQYGVDGAIDHCNEMYNAYNLSKAPTGELARHNRRIMEYLEEVKEEYSNEMCWLVA